MPQRRACEEAAGDGHPRPAVASEAFHARGLPLRAGSNGLLAFEREAGQARVEVDAIFRDGKPDLAAPSRAAFDEGRSRLGREARVIVLAQLLAERLDVVVLVVALEAVLRLPATARGIGRAGRREQQQPRELQVARAEAVEHVAVQPYYVLTGLDRERDRHALEDRDRLADLALGEVGAELVERAVQTEIARRVRREVEDGDVLDHWKWRRNTAGEDDQPRPAGLLPVPAERRFEAYRSALDVDDGEPGAAAFDFADRHDAGPEVETETLQWFASLSAARIVAAEQA